MVIPYVTFTTNAHRPRSMGCIDVPMFKLLLQGWTEPSITRAVLLILLEISTPF